LSPAHTTPPPLMSHHEAIPISCCAFARATASTVKPASVPDGEPVQPLAVSILVGVKRTVGCPFIPLDTSDGRQASASWRASRPFPLMSCHTATLLPASVTLFAVYHAVGFRAPGEDALKVSMSTLVVPVLLMVIAPIGMGVAPGPLLTRTVTPVI